MRREAVVDCSVSVAWFLPDERSELSAQLLRVVMRREVQVVVPELWHYEMLDALRTAVLRGRISEDQALGAVDGLRRARVETVSTDNQGLAVVLRTAMQLDLSVYDAAYVSLAESRGTDLVSADRGILRLRPRVPRIRSLPDFCGEL